MTPPPPHHDRSIGVALQEKKNAELKHCLPTNARMLVQQLQAGWNSCVAMDCHHNSASSSWSGVPVVVYFLVDDVLLLPVIAT